jgi:hypothetical protein
VRGSILGTRKIGWNGIRHPKIGDGDAPFRSTMNAWGWTIDHGDRFACRIFSGDDTTDGKRQLSPPESPSEL